MKSAILYPYGSLHGRYCCGLLHAKHLAAASGVYSLNISILVVLIYSWRIGININKYSELEEVYYGVQMAYLAIIVTQLCMVILSMMLLFGIYKISNMRIASHKFTWRNLTNLESLSFVSGVYLCK
ncbi:uncharacterized protein LOC113373082 [Ctenocephalides felis]|uniref:uncharacterized protein LOC113373082 n=1 Tax=Ctenocephalides felis TaxID=7515 RepID=UPI000E6E1D5F|nr:uncharacterized protein LOC113373082 [Ctenocephalides felis]